MRQKAFSPAVLSKKPFFKLHMHHMSDTHQAYDVFFSFFLTIVSFFRKHSPWKNNVLRYPSQLFSVK